jgi:hypothetical protein
MLLEARWKRVPHGRKAIRWALVVKARPNTVLAEVWQGPTGLWHSFGKGGPGTKTAAPHKRKIENDIGAIL